MKHYLQFTPSCSAILLMLLAACSNLPTTPLAQIIASKTDETSYPSPNKCRTVPESGLPVSDALTSTHILYQAGSKIATPNQVWSFNVMDGSRTLVLDNMPYPYYQAGLLSDSFHFVLVDVGRVWLSDLDGTSPRLVVSPSEISLILQDFPAYSWVRRIYDNVGSSQSPDRRITAIWNLGDPSLVISDSQTNEQVDVLSYDNHGYIAGNWSPNGAQYAITYSKNFQGEYSSVYIVNSDGTDLRELMQYENVELGRPYWSPDGKKIAYTLHKNLDFRPTYYQVLTVGSGEIRTFAVEADESLAWRNGNDIVWSPDGQWILFFTQESGVEDSKYDMKVINTLSSELYCITDDALIEIMADWR